MFWVPQSGDLGMGVSILSYDGEVQFGLVTDEGLCADPEAVIERFEHEFEKLVLATLMSPWPRDGDLDPKVAEDAISTIANLNGTAGRAQCAPKEAGPEWHDRH